MKVAVLGASAKPERYSYRAIEMLLEYGHEAIPISLSGEAVLGQVGYASLSEIPETERPVHTVTVYLNPARFEEVGQEVLEIQPFRVIFNPGSESPEWATRFRDAGIEVLEACTLVMLGTGQFDS